MSHWRKFSSNVLEDTNKKVLGRAIKEMDLGLEVNYNIKNIKNTWGTDNVDAGLVKNGSPIALGFKFNKETRDGKEHEMLQLTGDFYGTGLNEASFIDRLAQSYQKINIKEKMEDLGWNIDEEDITTTNNGEIVMEFSQFA